MKNRLTYFITSSSMFGIGFFLLFKNASHDAWLAVLLGTIIGVMIIYIYSKIKNYLKNNNLKDTLKQSTIGKIYLTLFIIFYLYLIVMILIILPMFVNSFYLLYTPKIIVIIPFLILAIYLTNKEKRVLETLSNLLFVVSLFIIITYILFLSKYVDFNNLIPVFNTKSISIIKAAFIYATISSIPQIITINFNNNDFLHEIKTYLIASLTIFGITIYTTLCLGDTLIKIYSFPEYAVLKQIKILDFIENIENLSTFIWYFNMFITLSCLTTNLKDTLPKKGNKIFYLSLIILTIIISIFIAGANYRIIITLFYTYPFVLFIFFILFILLLFYLKVNSKNNLKNKQ